MPQPRKKGLIVISPQELGSTFGGLPIRIRLDGIISRPPVDKPGEDRVRFELGPETVFVTIARGRRDGACASGINMIPRSCIRELAMCLMIKLASTPREITMLTEILRKGHPVLVLRHVTKPVQIAIDAGRRWPQPCHDCGT